MDKLDDIVRGAMRTLEGSTPRGYFDELPSRIEARLEGSMQSQSETDHRSSNELPPPGAAGQAGNEDSGLHDIKALASTAKRRISRRQTTQNEAQDVLTASGSGLHAVALPDPARMIALPTVEEARSLAASATGSMPAVASATEAPVEVVGARSPANQNQRTGRRSMMYAVGAVAAAAAAVGLFVMTRPNDRGEPKAAEVATRDQAAARAPAAAAAAGTAAAVVTPTAPPPSVQSIEVDVAEPADLGATGAVVPEAAALPEKTAPARSAKDAPDAKAERQKDGAGAGAADAKVKAQGKDDAVKTERAKGDKVDPAGAKVDPAADKTGAGTGGAKVEGDGKPKDDLDQSIEDLLNSPVEKKKVDKPDKTELSSKELRDGLGAVLGDAKACYAKHGEAGTVKVKITIAPSGSVSKASATGTFAGTPSGNCVASALKAATFPAWDGAPMSTTYAVLLSD